MTAPEPAEGPFPVSFCRHEQCKARIVWAVAEVSLKSMPVDYDPVEDGNVFLIAKGDGPPVARILKKDQRRHYTGLRKPHFVTCPGADEFRKRGKTREAGR